MSETEHEGGCLCGAVRYRVTGAPCGGNICYCSQCRRQGGSPLAAFVAYKLTAFTLLQGEPRSYRSSYFAVRQFCEHCGSALFWRQDGSDELDIFRGSLDAPELMPPPRAELWTIHRPAWLPPFPGIASYPGYRSPPPPR